jgi:drug/metabolite transporter (DMT)-like permease
MEESDIAVTDGSCDALRTELQGRAAMKSAQYRLGLALIIASTIAWSTAGFFTRLIPLDAWTLLAWRGIFGGLGIAVASFFLEGRHFRLSIGSRGWLFAIVSAVAMILFIVSLTLTTVAHVAVIYAIIPFVAAGLGWLILHERPSVHALVASAAALIGVAVMMRLGTGGGWLGDAIAFAMTLCMAAMMVVARRFKNNSALRAAALSAFLSALACWPLGHPLAVSGHDLVLLAFFGLANSALGIGLFALGARYLPAVETALIGALDAPLAPLWVWLAFNETPSGATLIGGLIVFAAVGTYLAIGAAKSRTAHALLPCEAAEGDRA